MASHPLQSKESLGSSLALQGQPGNTGAKDFFVEKREVEMEKHRWERAIAEASRFSQI